MGVFHYFFFELDAEMSLPHTPAWPLCSLSLFSSASPRVPQLLPSPPPCPPCWHFPFPACAGVREAPSNPLKFLLPIFTLPKSPLPFPTQGREGAAGTSRIMELLLRPSQGSTWTGPSLGICRSGGARGWERRWWPRSSPSHPLLRGLWPFLFPTLPAFLLDSRPADFGDHPPRSPTAPGDPLGPLHHPAALSGGGLASWDGRWWEGSGASPLPCEPPTPGGPPCPHPGWDLGARAPCLDKPCGGSPG